MKFPNLNAEMARKDISQKSLSMMLGWDSISKISRKLNGQSPITLEEAMDIKKVLDVDIPLEELFEQK